MSYIYKITLVFSCVSSPSYSGLIFRRTDLLILFKWIIKKKSIRETYPGTFRQGPQPKPGLDLSQDVTWFDTVSKTILNSDSYCHLISNRSSIHGIHPAQKMKTATKVKICQQAVAGEISAPRQWRSERWCHRKYHMSASESLPALIIFGTPFLF